ncbi:MAG: hypothetical protein KGK07_16290, partial [Chloroflexota bacterium]|nr:hypothetical protein [Chloroflexota bacterium]
MNATRVRPGVYRVPSETVAGWLYNVQVTAERGVCDCIGASTHGTECKHIRHCRELEAKHMSENTNPDGDSRAVTVAKPGAMLTPITVEPPSALLPSTAELRVMVTIANSIHKTAGKLIPSNIRTSEEAFAVMLAGHELGIPAMASFREIYVVNGRTLPSARVLMGLVLRGDPAAQFRWFERSEKRAAVRLVRGNGQTIDVEYTIEDATRAGLLKNEVWKLYPKDMLAYKAATRACRLGGPDLITAIGASVRGAPSVMEAIEDEPGQDEEPMPQLEPTAVEPDAAPPAERDATPEYVTPPASRIRALLRAFPDDQRRTLIEGINLKCGRTVLTSDGETMLGRAAPTPEQMAEIVAFLESALPSEQAQL